MPATQPYELEPSALLRGTSEEAGRFLDSVLSGEYEAFVPVWYVLNWVQLLHGRGDGFASQTARCHSWLYGHHRGFTSDRSSGAD